MLPDGFGKGMPRLENARDEYWQDATSLRSSTASGASFASRHLDSDRPRVSPFFYQPLLGVDKRDDVR